MPPGWRAARRWRAHQPVRVRPGRSGAALGNQRLRVFRPLVQCEQLRNGPRAEEGVRSPAEPPAHGTQVPVAPRRRRPFRCEQGSMAAAILFALCGAPPDLPPQTQAGMEGFLRRWHANPTARMPNAVQERNPLQFDTFTDYEAAWDLSDRPRRLALLIDDVQVEYEAYVRGILPQIKALVEAFRRAGHPIFWSTWWRWGPDDGHFNAMDRFYGPAGIADRVNALYNYQPNGGDVLPDVAPTTDEEQARVMHKFYSLDMFDERPTAWLQPRDQGTLDDELRKLEVDTVVQVGAWTGAPRLTRLKNRPEAPGTRRRSLTMCLGPSAPDDCIISTAMHAFSLQYDVVVVADAVSTASKAQFAAVEVMRGAVAKILPTAHVIHYLATLPGAVAPNTEALGPLLGANARAAPTAPWERDPPVPSSDPGRGAGVAEVARFAQALLVAALAWTVGYRRGLRAGRAGGVRPARTGELLLATRV